MRLSLLGISLSVFALILTSSGSATTLGLGVSFLGVIVALVSFFVGG